MKKLICIALCVAIAACCTLSLAAKDDKMETDPYAVPQVKNAPIALLYDCLLYTSFGYHGICGLHGAVAHFFHGVAVKGKHYGLADVDVLQVLMVLIQLEIFNVGIGVFKRYNAVYALQLGILFHVDAGQHVHLAVGKHGGLGECFGIGHYNGDVVQINGTLVFNKGQVGLVIRIGLKDYAVAGDIFIHVERAVGDSCLLYTSRCV